MSYYYDHFLNLSPDDWVVLLSVLIQQARKFLLPPDKESKEKTVLQSYAIKI